MKLRKGFAYIIREEIFFFWSHLSVCFPFLPQSRLSSAVFFLSSPHIQNCVYENKATRVASDRSEKRERVGSGKVRPCAHERGKYFPQITPTTKTTKKIAILHFLA